MGRIIVGCIVLAVLCVGLSYGDVPSLMNYQGRLTDDNGAPVGDTKSMTFEFRDAPAAGNLLGGFSETQSVVVTNGLFNVLIGSDTPGGVPQTVFDGPDVYLSVKVEGEELTPRQRIATVGFAFRAANADALEARVAALEALLAGASRNGNDITLSGVNLHINNGTGSTNGVVNGLGNLIVGYNELRGAGSDDRSGSHSIVVGKEHNFTSYGGLVAGQLNSVSGPYASASGGRNNTASGSYSAVSGGLSNIATGAYSSVNGGHANTASGYYSCVNSGYENTASGEYSSVSGGNENTTSGKCASVSGGNKNTASGDCSSVGGGHANTASGKHSSVSGGTQNKARGDFSSVSGGGGRLSSDGNQAYARFSAISGGYRNTVGNPTDDTIGESATVSGGRDRSVVGDFDWRAGGLWQDQ